MSVKADAQARLEQCLAEAEEKAWDALGRYKFQMFGYWAAIWVHLNRISGDARPNPFASAVRLARERRATPVTAPTIAATSAAELISEIRQ